MRPSLSGRVGDSMVKLYEDGIYLRGGSEVVPAAEAAERGITVHNITSVYFDKIFI